MENKYLVVGTGALGSVFGGLLRNQGLSVTFIGKGEHFEKVRKDGIVIDGIWGEFHITSPDAYYDSDTCRIKDQFDVALICVKSQDTGEATEIAKSLLKPDGICISIQNGLGNVEKIAEVVGGKRTVGGRVIFGVEINKPGVATVSVYADKVLLGEPFEPVNRVIMEKTKLDLNNSGIPTDITDNILGSLWAKSLYNCALNPLSAILNVSYGELAEDENTQKLMKEIIREIYEVAKAKKINMLKADAEAYIEHFFNSLIPPTREHHSSMYQDLRAGRKTEIEAMNKIIVRYAEEFNISVPVNRFVSQLINFKENHLFTGQS
jgi:2-dehydropantoate 2-reductase